MKNTTTIYLIRHAESEANIKEVANESAESVSSDEYESDLSARGWEQAKALAHELKNVPFNAIYSSDLRRAVSTASCIADGRGIPVQQSNKIREVYYGRHNHSYYKVKQQIIDALKKLPEEEKMKYQFDDMETEEHGVNRLLDFTREVSAQHVGEKIAVVCHGKIMRLFLIKAGFGLYDELPSGSVKNAAYVIALYDGKNFTVTETHGVNKMSLNS